jgi:hypothetical protein
MSTGRLLVVSGVFLVVRTLTILAYQDTLYYYGMIASQFGIAEAAYEGHWFAHDPALSGAALEEAQRSQRHIPLEEWGRFEASGRYATFPAVDLPGLGYLIAFTSRWFDTRLTTRYALVIQVALELGALLLFAGCAASVFGERVATLAALLYVFAYPFIWPIVSHPMRDAFLPAVYLAFVGGVFAFGRGLGWRLDIAAALLVALGSVLLWIRPSAYYFPLFLAPLALLVGRRGQPARGAFLGILLLAPWLIFGYPYRLFNLRHYGVANTDALGRALWERMGIIEDNPYGFVQKDEALVPWVKAHYGKDVEYSSPEMNRLLGEYARRVMAKDPGYYLRTVLRRCWEIAKTPLDFVPPFPLVEYATSGLSPGEYAREYPGSFAFKVFNRLILAVFFYGGIILTVRMVVQHRQKWREIALLMSPFTYTLSVQVLLRFEQRYMAVGAWVLVLPMALWLQSRWLGRRDTARGAT